MKRYQKQITFSLIVFSLVLGVFLGTARHYQGKDKATLQASGVKSQVSGYDPCSGSLALAGIESNCPNQSKPDTQQSESNVITQVTSSPIASRTTSSNSYTPYVYNPSLPSAPQCNQSLKQSALDYRNSSIAYENALHNSWTSGLPADSSYYADAKAKEDARHVAALAKIEQQYQQSLAQAYCS